MRWPMTRERQGWSEQQFFAWIALRASDKKGRVKPLTLHRHMRINLLRKFQPLADLFPRQRKAPEIWMD
jgi:hypothetical protein